VLEFDGKPSIANNSVSDEHFDRKLLHISYKNGVYYLKSSGFTNIYRKFVPEQNFSIFPGHRVCFGSNVFYLLQYINFSIGEQNTILVKEYTSISELTTISLYAVIESVGLDPTCKDYIHKNLHDKIANAARELRLDQSTTFYKTLANVIYKAYDDLDIGFMNMYPLKRKTSGAKVLLYMIIGNKLICVNLGDIQGYLIIGSKLKKTNIKHNIVSLLRIKIVIIFRATILRRKESREFARESVMKEACSSGLLDVLDCSTSKDLLWMREIKFCLNSTRTSCLQSLISLCTP
jgi:Protein phosphatase 2C